MGKGIQNERQATGVAWRWQHQGLETQITDKFVLVHGDGWRLADYGNRCLLDTVTPEGVEALITKARRDWNGTVQCHGSQHFLEQAWLEAQRQGVDFSVRDDPDWTPPEHIQLQWQLELEELKHSAQLSEDETSDYTSKAEIETIRFGM